MLFFCPKEIQIHWVQERKLPSLLHLSTLSEYLLAIPVSFCFCLKHALLGFPSLICKKDVRSYTNETNNKVFFFTFQIVILGVLARAYKFSIQWLLHSLEPMITDYIHESNKRIINFNVITSCPTTHSLNAYDQLTSKFWPSGLNNKSIKCPYGAVIDNLQPPKHTISFSLFLFTRFITFSKKQTNSRLKHTIYCHQVQTTYFRIWTKTSKTVNILTRLKPPAPPRDVLNKKYRIVYVSNLITFRRCCFTTSRSHYSFHQASRHNFGLPFDPELIYTTKMKNIRESNG